MVQLHWWQEERVEVGEPVLDDADQRAGTLARCHRRLRRLLGNDERQSTANGEVVDRHLVLLLAGSQLVEHSESQKPSVVARGLQVLLLAKELCARVGDWQDPPANQKPHTNQLVCKMRSLSMPSYQCGSCGTAGRRMTSDSNADIASSIWAWTAIWSLITSCPRA